MKLDFLHKSLIVLLILGLAGGVIGARSWLDAHDAALTAKTAIAAQKAADAQSQKQIEAIQEAARQQAQETAATIARLQSQAARAVTPEQIASYINQATKPAQPIVVQTPAPTAENPNPKPELVIPSSETEAARNYVSSCEQCKVSLAGEQSSAESLTKQVALEKAQETSLQKQRDEALNAMKGGPWLQRLAKDTKRGAGAVGGAAIGAAACSNSNGVTVAACAAVGAGIGFVISHL